MKLQQLLRCVPVLRGDLEDPGQEIPVISHRSDSDFRGGLFIALRGQKQDGNRFVEDAAHHGAHYVITDCDIPPCSLHVIRVPDARVAMARIWSNYYENPADEMRMVGVTGTNGKTTTTYMLQAILQEAGYKTGMIGTVNGAMTTPDPEELYRRLRQMADTGTQFVAMEASSHALCYGKLDPIRFECGIFTNLTPEHLDFHGTMEAYRDAKAILFTHTKQAYFNYDDLYGRQLYSEAFCDKYYYSAQNFAADYHAGNIRDLGVDGVEYHLFCTDMLFRITSRIPGDFTVYNTMAAAACARGLGIHPRKIRTALQKMTGVPGRMQRVPIPQHDFAVFIDFAHTPDALEKLLRTVRRWMTEEQRLIVLFGCGGDRDRSKRPVMGSIATRLADVTVLTSDNSRSEDPRVILEEILRGVDPNAHFRVICDRREAIVHCIEHARPGDVILLAGKGHEDYEITAKGKFPFCERDIVLQAAKRRMYRENE